MLGEFKKTFVKLSQTPEARTIDGERWINKTTLFQHIMTLTRRGQAQVYRNYKEVSEHFDEKRVGRYGYVKVIIEQLNAFGAEGWKLAAMLNVGETQLVGFLTKENRKDAPDPKQSEADKIASIWTASNKDDE